MDLISEIKLLSWGILIVMIFEIKFGKVILIMNIGILIIK